MALTNTIRKHSGLLVGLITIGLILFLIGGDIVRLVPILSGKHKTEVGEIAGQKITLKEYQAQVERLRQFLPSSASMEESWIRNQAWRQFIVPIVYQQECRALGLMISEDELVDMVQGNHIHPELQVAFQNSETKQFDKQQLTKYLQKLAQMPEEQRVQWHQFESGLATLRQREKVIQLMEKSTFITELEEKAQQNTIDTTLHVKCLYVPYYTHSEDAIQVSDKMLKDYLTKHKNTYQIEESRKIQYITFPIIPSEEDERTFQEELQTLKQSFAQAKDDRAFASINTDGQPSLSYFNYTPQQLPNALAKQESHLKKGLVIGPIQEGNVYKLYKVAAINPQSPQKYAIAIIDKQLIPGDQSRDQLFRKADYCASTIKNVTQLEAYAAKEALQLREAQVGKNTVKVGSLTQARELVRWLYNEAVLGKVSPVFELDNAYVVAVMIEHIPAGTAPLSRVRDEISLKVSNELKARAIMAKLQEITSTTLEEKIAHYGNNARLLEIKNMRFEDDTLQGAGMARKTVGTAFGLEPGVQATVADENGVLVVEVITRNTALDPQNTIAHQKNLRKTAKAMQPYRVLQALEALSQIKDYRYKFY